MPNIVNSKSRIKRIRPIIFPCNISKLLVTMTLIQGTRFCRWRSVNPGFIPCLLYRIFTTGSAGLCVSDKTGSAGLCESVKTVSVFCCPILADRVVINELVKCLSNRPFYFSHCLIYDRMYSECWRKTPEGVRYYVTYRIECDIPQF